MKEELTSNLRRIVDLISKFDGVVCIILFGSYAGGITMNIQTMIYSSSLRTSRLCGGVGAPCLEL
ncbi:MAG: hypothetical protein RMI99_02920 [Nitrososphaerota archaeon]|nr:hypothetical protein [Candidatus Nezhaarchaeota archaeon]MDW8050014.1 hypothetical protein [Nitrososphaerota archaeon]